MVLKLQKHEILKKNSYDQAGIWTPKHWSESRTLYDLHPFKTPSVQYKKYSYKNWKFQFFTRSQIIFYISAAVTAFFRDLTMAAILQSIITKIVRKNQIGNFENAQWIFRSNWVSFQQGLFQFWRWLRSYWR